MKELVLELLCHLLRAGQGLEFMAEQPLNDAMNDISLTSQYAGDLKTLPHKCRAGEKGSKGEEVQGPRADGLVHELWDGRETSAKGIQNLGSVHTYMKQLALELLCCLVKPG